MRRVFVVLSKFTLLSCVMGLCVLAGCATPLARAKRKVQMYEKLAPEAADLKRGELQSTLEIADRMDGWASKYSASNDIPLKTRLELAQRLRAAIPRYLLSASQLVTNPALAYTILTYRPRGARRTLELPQALAAARKHAEAITAAKQHAFSGTYPRRGRPVRGREQGTCFFATEPFDSGKNQALTVRVQRQTTYVHCYLPSWWKDAGGVETALLVGLHPGTGYRVPLPPRSATEIDFVLNLELFGEGPSAEKLYLSVGQTVHNQVLRVGQRELVVSKARSSTQVASAELLWDPES